jgi:hypothetical protein
MTEQPLVSVLVTPHDGEDRLAATLASVRAQSYPAERLELILVEDSTIGALDRALGKARGELIALLDAGDRWPAGRIAAQVTAFAEQPNVGLVYSELLPLDGDPPSGRPASRLLREPPCIGSSSIALRAELLEEIGPLPQELLHADWWLVVRVACLAEIAWVPSPSLPLPADEKEPAPSPLLAGSAERQALLVQRWFLRHATPESLYADALGEIWAAFLTNARRVAAAGAGDPFVELLTVTDGERAEARRMLDEARDVLAHGDSWSAAALAVQAAALNPWLMPARELLAETLAARPRRAGGDPLAGARRFVTLAFADELLAHPELLAAYGAHFDGAADATLAIDASTLMPIAAGHALGELVAEAGLDRDGTAHLIAVLGPIDATVRARLPEQADALLTCEGREAMGATPAFDADSIDALRELALRLSAA